MGIISKIGSFGVQLGGSKGVRKTATRATKNLAGSAIKTSSALTNSVSVLSGGIKGARRVVSNVAKSAGGKVIKVGGAALGVTAVVGGAAVGVTKVYDYILDVKNKTDSLRQYDMTLDLAEREQGLIQKAKADQNLYNMEGTGGQRSSDMALGGTLGDYLPILGGISDRADAAVQGEAIKAGATKSVMNGILILGAVGGGIYLLSKSKYFKKKKVTKK